MDVRPLAWIIALIGVSLPLIGSGYLDKAQAQEEATVTVTPTPAPTPVPFPGKLTGEWFVPALTCAFCDSMVGQEIKLDQPKTILKYYDKVLLDPKAGSGVFVLKTEKVTFDLIVKVDEKAKRLVLLYFDGGELPRVGESFAHFYVIEPTGNDQLLYGESYSVNIYDEDAFIDDVESKTWRADPAYFDDVRVLALLEDVRVTTMDEDRRLFVPSQAVRVSLEGAFALFRLELSSEDLAQARRESVEDLRGRAERVALFRTLVASGDERYTQGDYDSAAAQYQAASSIRPGESIIYANLGAVYQMQKKYIEADRMYQIAVDLSPNNPDVLFNLGAIAEGQRQWSRAKSLYEQVLRLTPDDLQAQERIKVVSGMAQ